MTGKELIYYILENDLLNENVVQDGVPIFLMPLDEAAAKFDVGPSTIEAWAVCKNIEFEIFDGRLYIYKTAKDPRK